MNLVIQISIHMTRLDQAFKLKFKTCEKKLHHLHLDLQLRC